MRAKFSSPDKRVLPLSKRGLNYKVLLIFAPVLLLVGVLGFVLPAESSPTSGAPAYNVFHLAAGALGLILLVLRNENYVRAFNLVFGLIDLYQAAAGFADFFPEQYFRWTTVDDVLHILVGLLLVSVALYGYLKRV
jgi:hypothetical protein